jgi:phenylpropionate dioxygenase-like ring-hydroxylating dioxygenase large terminal subunit
VNYARQQTLETEHSRIYRRAWHLIGLESDIPLDNDFYRKRIGMVDLVMHRYEGQIVAYANVCPHRFSAFFNTPIGNSPIRCPYHLWTFNGDGMAIGVPHRQGEALECYQGPELRMDMWQVKQLGQFVFVSAQPLQILADFLGPMHAIFLQLSDALGKERPPVTQDFAADWKLVLQNTVEFEHAFSVHPETFAKAMQKPIELHSDPAAPNVISYTARMNPDRHKHPRDARVDSIFRRVSNPYPDGYRHHLVFPTTSIGYTDNRQLAVMDYQPIGPGQCRMYARLFDFKIPDLTPSEASMLEIVGPWDLQYTHRLFEEDRAICEAVQLGLASRPASMRGTFQRGEHLVQRFQEIYCRWMDT